MMTDKKIHDSYKPLQIPSSYNKAQNMQEKVIYALADLGEGSADQVVKNLERLENEVDPKEMIAAAHDILTELYEKGFVGGNERDGTLVYDLRKITRSNSGSVNND